MPAAVNALASSFGECNSEHSASQLNAEGIFGESQSSALERGALERGAWGGRSRLRRIFNALPHFVSAWSQRSWPVPLKGTAFESACIHFACKYALVPRPHS